MIFVSLTFASNAPALASVQRRNEDNIISLLKFVFLLAFKFPIGVIDQD